MPLVDLSSTEAVDNRKTNPVAGWAPRTGANRVEPVCTPAFDVPFRFDPGEAVFTVGSCFARNVEQELVSRGFTLPTREVLRRPAFQKVEPAVLNNFGTPSIHNEFAWAFGEKPYELDDHIVELAAGKWADVHLIPSIRPDTRENVAARREAIREAYKASAQCRVIIMTLGYVEVWFDTKTGFYLNSTPRPGMLRADPERYRLRVLSFEETWHHLDAALKLIVKHGHPDVRVVLTVSPVPLASTHRSEDVILANTYSKSVLRVAAETARATHPFVTYFPSYESITLSDRKQAWKDDQVHVTPEIVALNVGRMVDAFVGSSTDMETLRDQIERGGLSVALEKARTLPELSPTDADAFFEAFGPQFSASLEFSLASARHAIARTRPDDALRVLDAVSEADRDTSVVVVERARAYSAKGDRARALELYRNLVESGADLTRRAHNDFLVAAEAADDEAAMNSAMTRITARFPGFVAPCRVRIGRWHLRNGRPSEAHDQFNAAIKADPALPGAYIALTEAQLALGEDGKAKETFAKVKPSTPTDVKRADRLRLQLE